MYAHVKMESHNLACFALRMVPRNASHAIPGGLEAVTKPSASVRAYTQPLLRSARLQSQSLLFVIRRACPLSFYSEGLHVQERRGRNWSRLPY